MSFCFFFPAVRCMTETDQLLLEGLTTRTVLNGPGIKVVGPFQSIAQRRTGAELGKTQYIHVVDSLQGTRKLVKGPKFHFLEPFEEHDGIKEAYALSPTDYVKIEDNENGDIRVEVGPQLWFPAAYDVVVGGVQPGIQLESTEYLKVEDLKTGEPRIQLGPILWFPGPFDKVIEKKSGISLSPTQYLKIEDKQGGKVRITKGPTIWFPKPYDNVIKSGNAYSLSATQYLKVEDTKNGEVLIVTGPCLWMPGPYDEVTEQKDGLSLSAVEYIKIEDTETGVRSVVKGPQLWFPGKHDKVNERLKCISLKHNEFLKTVDNKTGVMEVHVGETTVYLKPTEEIVPTPGGKKQVSKAVNVDEHTAVLVRTTETGQIHLIHTPQLFFPKAHEEIEEIRDKIVLEDHQVVIIKNKDGHFIFKEGKSGDIYEDIADPENSKKKSSRKGSRSSSRDSRDKQDSKPVLELVDEVVGSGKRSFFLPPYCELVTVNWYSSEDMIHQAETITHFDLRPHFMTYEFICRTCDNVELRVDLTFFWEISDIRKMIHKTDDLPGDICNHARSCIISDVSHVTMEKFMAEFNPIISKAVLEGGDEFYVERGATVHTVEVRSIHCVDKETEKVLQEIIKETTDRLKRLQKQASENEVRLFKMKGDIEEEKLNGELLRIRKDHHKAEQLLEGEGQADQVVAFLKGLSLHKVPFDEQVHMWETLRKLDGMTTMAETDSTFYFTPNDVNLSIETISEKNPHLQRKRKALHPQE